MISKKVFALTLLTLSPVMGSACDGVWISMTASTNWNNAANWAPCIPGATGSTATDTAVFPSTAVPDYFITLDINAGLSAMVFNSPSTDYEIIGGLNQFFFNTSSPLVDVFAGSHALDAYSLVANGSTLGINIASGSMLTWLQGAGANPAGPFNLNYAGPGEVRFNWNGVGPLTSSTINLGTGNFSIQNGPFLIDNTVVPHAGVPNGTSVTNANNVTVSNGVLALQNSATISFDVAPMVTGAALSGTSLTLQNGSVFSLSNTGAITGTTHPDIGSYAALSSIVSNGGSITLNNSGPAQNGGVGNQMNLSSGPMTLSGGSLTLQNTGSISNAAVGNFLSLPGSFVANNASISMNNAGSVTGALATGNAFEVSSLGLSNSSMAISNSGVATNGIGSIVLITGLPTTVINTGTTLTATNSGQINSMGVNSFGVLMELGSLTLNGGTVNFNNSGNILSPTVAGFNAFGVGALITSNLTINSGTLSLQNTGNVGPNSFGVSLTSQNLIMTGGSLLNHGGNIQALTSGTVNGGLFANNGTFTSPSLSIGPAGTVSGSGIFTNPGGIAVTNAGTLIVGSPTGVMTIQGTYTQTPTAAMIASVGSSFSQLRVSNTAQIAGTLTTAYAGGNLAGQKFVILNAGGGLSGQFQNVTSSFILQPHVEYTPNSVIVSFTLPTPNYPNYLVPLFSTVNHINGRLERQMAQLRSRFTPKEEMVHEPVAEAEELLVDNSPELVAVPAVEEKQQQLKRRLGSPQPCPKPWNVYLGPKGNIGRVLSHQKNPGYHYDTAGAEAGFDYAFSRLGIGFMADYDHLNARAAHHWGKFDVNQLYGSLYATYIRRAEQQLAFNLILGGGYDWYDIRRKIPGGAGGVVKGHPQGLGYDALAGMEYTFEKKGACSHWQVVTLVNLQYIYLHVNRYQEKGASGFNLDYHSQNARSLRSMAGLRMNHTWKWTHAVFTPEINLGWQWEFFDKERHLGVAFAGVPTRIPLTTPGKNTALGGLDLLLTLWDKYGIEASYDFEWNTRYMDHFLYLGICLKHF